MIVLLWPVCVISQGGWRRMMPNPTRQPPLPFLFPAIKDDKEPLLGQTFFSSWRQNKRSVSWRKRSRRGNGQPRGVHSGCWWCLCWGPLQCAQPQQCWLGHFASCLRRSECWLDRTGKEVEAGGQVSFSIRCFVTCVFVFSCFRAGFTDIGIDVSICQDRISCHYQRFAHLCSRGPVVPSLTCPLYGGTDVSCTQTLL